MDTVEKLKRLQLRMKEILNTLNNVNDNLTKIEESNSYAISVNTTTYKGSEIENTKNKITEQMRIIRQSILPSLEKEIKELENK